MNVLSQTPLHAAEDAVLRQIAEYSKNDPLLGAKVGSNELTQRLMAIMKDERGVHLESLLCALGAIAGYACQARIRAESIAHGLPEAAVLTARQGDDGQTYYFGDHLDDALADSAYSVWAVASGETQQAPDDEGLDLAEIFEHAAAVFGTAEFGKPRVATCNAAEDSPLNYLRSLWPALEPLIVKYCPDPAHWPVLVSLSIQEAIIMGESALEPCLALQLVMETAIPMSKVDLNTLIAEV